MDDTKNIPDRAPERRRWRCEVCGELVDRNKDKKQTVNGSPMHDLCLDILIAAHGIRTVKHPG
jgi:hypothetical protein